MRLRFAPSPTGYLHVGGLRTALFNYLLARQDGGQLILRIEDTDQSRRVEGAVENLIETLKWAGLDYDEGPGREGDCGPYYQSQRLDIYRYHVEQLLETRQAYPCFCSTERLAGLRRDQESRNLRTRYDGLCRQIDPGVAHERMQQEAHVIRMKVPPGGEILIDDRVRGQVTYPLDQIEDQILVKSDGFPTYHLANVVDDHLMGIDCVVRGEEWLPSTPKHLLLYDYFGWEKPVFAHLPLLLNRDRSKLSKRQGDVAVEDYRRKGFDSRALVNFVALLGWNPGDEREFFNLDELVREFSLERVNKAGAVFDLEKLTWMNGQVLRQLPAKEYLREARSRVADDPVADSALLAVRSALDTWQDLDTELAIFRATVAEPEDDAAQELLQTEASVQVLGELLTVLETLPELNTATFLKAMKTVQQATGVKGKALWMPVRVALTGQIHGPELTSIVTIFGSAKVRERLQAALGN